LTSAEQAVVRVYVGCKIALEAIDDLPQDAAEAVEEPIREFCRRLEPFVGNLLNAASRAS
jgi:hypothetical protein